MEVRTYVRTYVTHSLCDSFTVASLRNYVCGMGAEYIGEILEMLVMM